MPWYSRPSRDSVAMSFIIDRLRDKTAQSYFDASRFERFRELVRDGHGIAAAKEYCDVTGAGIGEARLCVEIMRRMNA